MDRKIFANFSIPPFAAEQGWYEQRKLLVGNVSSASPHDLDSPVLLNGPKTNIMKDPNSKKLPVNPRILLERNAHRKGKTIIEKLIDLYLQNALESDTAESNFVKCNYLEELVATEKYNYFILKLYPEYCTLGMFFADLCIVSEFAKFSYDEYDKFSDLFKDVDNEEIHSILLDLCMDSTEPSFYNFHAIVQVQKFMSTSDIEPFCSTFVLLKPTGRIIFECCNRHFEAKGLEKEMHFEVGLEYEKNLCFESAGPLYLSSDKTCFYVSAYCLLYKSPFASTSLKDQFGNPQKCVDEAFEIYHQNILKLDGKTSLHLRDLPTSDFLQLPHSPSFSLEDVKKQFCQHLNSRTIFSDDIEHKDHRYRKLLEIFYFCKIPRQFNISSTAIGPTKNVENVYKISVFQKNQQFYTFLAPSEEYFEPEDIHLFHVVDRDRLDKYIVKVAEILSNKFNAHMQIDRECDFNTEKKKPHGKRKRFFEFKGRRYDYKVKNERGAFVDPFHKPDAASPDVDMETEDREVASNPEELVGDESGNQDIHAYACEPGPSSSTVRQEMPGSHRAFAESILNDLSFFQNSYMMGDDFIIEPPHSFEAGESSSSSSPKAPPKKKAKFYSSVNSKFKYELKDFADELVLTDSRRKEIRTANKLLKDLMPR